MKIGIIGLGKLGLPVAIAIQNRGHEVLGFDTHPKFQNISTTSLLPIPCEKNEDKTDTIKELFSKHPIPIAKTLSDLVVHSDIIFVAIQTPHQERFEGHQPLPKERADFDYTPLARGMESLNAHIKKLDEQKVVAIISTVLPGTLRREILPLLHSNVQLCYNPFFIAMGTVIYDFYNPEFVLLGHINAGAEVKVREFYNSIHKASIYATSLENAELIKVAYNTFIGMKLTFVNVLMEMCHKTGCNVDHVTDALKMANKRLISTKYLTAGMGDGGACHPRDNIAMSWLAQELDLSHNFFDDLMMARERQTLWLADLIEEHSGRKRVYILGKSFKPETNITTGSPAILLYNLLKEKGRDDVVMYDPYIDSEAPQFKRGLYFIATKHPEFLSFTFPPESTVLDPWRYILPQPTINLIPVGSR